MSWPWDDGPGLLSWNPTIVLFKINYFKSEVHTPFYSALISLKIHCDFVYIFHMEYFKKDYLLLFSFTL